MTGYIEYVMFQSKISSLIFIESSGTILTFLTSIIEDIKFGRILRIRSIMWTSLSGVELFIQAVFQCVCGTIIS